MRKPLAIDLFCGLGGWTDGLLAEGWRVIGYDIEAHAYGDDYYKGEFVLQDVLAVHGSQFKDAHLIVASPPCQEFSYMAMPWKRAKQIGRALRGQDEFPEKYTGSRTLADLTALFDACFRIQREASETAGRHIPLIVENVRGANAWVGRSKYNFGSFHLWGDVPALMPKAQKASKMKGRSLSKDAPPEAKWGSHDVSPFHGDATEYGYGRKVPGFRFDGSGKSFQTAATKVLSMDGGRRTDKGKGARFTSRDCGVEGTKNGNDWFGSGENCSVQRKHASGLVGRKAAAARIAKIPETLSRHIGQVFYPRFDLEYDL